jgi:hypothetical protein
VKVKVKGKKVRHGKKLVRLDRVLQLGYQERVPVG